jgi:negative regulator of flagellin synthesis FlgM
MEALMVEPINTSQGRPRIVKPGEDIGIGAAGKPTAGTVLPAAMPAAGDSVKLSASAQAVPAELKEAGPPMDLEIVKRIKDAISEGKYPIDLEKITESLFQDYLELTN